MKPGNRLLILLAIVAVILLSGGLTNSLNPQRAGTLVASWLTICVFSFLWRDNPFYKLAEHLMVGLAMGYFAIYFTFQILEPQWWDRLVRGNLLPGEELFGSSAVFRYALIIPAILGLLMLTRVFPKIGWLSRWSMATVIGIGSGLAIPWTIQTNVTSQLLTASLLPARYVEALNGARPFGASGFQYNFSQVPFWEIGVPILIIGTLCGLIYFFFSIPHRGVIGKAASLGVWVLMIGFGTSFGLTVMARLSLFIGRILYIFKDWLGVIR